MTGKHRDAIDKLADDTSKRTVAEENFKATFGQYPIRAELPEPTPDATIDRRVHKLLTGRDDYRPDLKVVNEKKKRGVL